MSGDQGVWSDRQVSAQEAVSVVAPGDSVFIGTACATPLSLLEALESRAVPGVSLVHFISHTVDPAAPKSRYRHRVFYVGRDERALHESPLGQVEYLPVSLPDVPSLFESGQLPLDVALIQVAPPDPDGTCSLGISVDITRAAALQARIVLAEVNPNMPRTAGESRIPVDRVNKFVAVDRPLLEYLHEGTAGAAERIARYVARLIEDGSTLQIGLGRVPNEMLSHLTNRRDLAIHSDVITEPLVELAESGVVSGPVAASWAMGSRRLYELVDDDPRFTFHPIDYVCDPEVIGNRDRVVSVTQAFRIDLTGQVCTESLDGALYGGISTGPAFHRGALRSKDGLAIICLSSLTPGGQSGITAEFGPDEAVAIPRAEVHWVITEYGTAYLFGRSLAERAVALIDIAHPDARAGLLQEAIARRLVSRKQQLHSRTAYPVNEARSIELRDGRAVLVRPTRTSDTRAMQALFHRLSEEDVRTRFFQKLTSLTDTAAQHLCSVDYEEEMAFAAVLGPPENERIVAASTYYLSPASGLAEVAYMVDPEWQGAGLGSKLHSILTDYARRHGARGLRADVLSTNLGMMRVFERGDHDLTVQTDAGVQELRMLFSPADPPRASHSDQAASRRPDQTSR